MAYLFITIASIILIIIDTCIRGCGLARWWALALMDGAARRKAVERVRRFRFCRD